MTDDDRESVLPLNRRDAMKTFGIAAVAGTGSMIAFGGENAQATPLSERPISVLPGASYYETTTQEYFDNHDNSLGREIDIVANRGIQMRNVRALDRESVARTPCGDEPGVEYRFVVSGIAQGVVKNPRGDGSYIIEHTPPVIGETDEVVSVEADVDGDCGSGTLQPHTTEVETSEIPRGTWFSGEGDLPEGEDEFREALESLFETSDRIDSAISMASTMRGNAETVNNLTYDVDVVADFLDETGTWLGRGSHVLDGIEMLEDLFEDPTPDPETGSAFSNTGISLEAGHAAGVTYMADFTVKTPSGTGGTVRVDLPFNWAGGSESYLQAYTQRLADTVTFVIELPEDNEAGDALEELTLPTIRVVGEDGDAESLPIGANQTVVDVGEEVSFEAQGSTFQRPYEVDAYRWRHRSEVIDGETASFEFDRPGTTEVELTAVGEDTVQGEPTNAFETRHKLTFEVGENHLMRPQANFRRTSGRVREGEEVTLDASASSPGVGEIQSYEWEIRPNVDQTGVEPDSLYESGEVVTFTPGSYPSYRVELTVEDDEHYTDTSAQLMTVRAPTNATFSIEPDDPEVGEAVTLDASAAEAGVGDIEAYEWTVYRWLDRNPDNVLVADELEGETVTYTPRFDTRYSARLHVRDESEFGDTESQIFNVDPAIVAEFSIEPDDPEVGDEVTLDAVRSLPKEGDLASYRWTVSAADDDRVLEELTGEEVTFEISEEVTHVVTLEVEDEGGNIDEADAELRVGEPIRLGEYEPQPYGDDGLYRDVDGTGSVGSNDVIVFFEHIDDPVVQNNPQYFDFAGTGKISHSDVIALFGQI